MTNAQNNGKFKIGAAYVIRGQIVDNDPNGLFIIMPTKKRINSKQAQVVGPYNYVSRGTTNNGIAKTIQFNDKYLNEANTLSFAQDTAAVFYQDKPYFTGNKVNILKLNDKYGKLNREIAMYLCAQIRNAFPDFTWGTLLNIQKIADTQIELPVTPSGTPDFEYMEERIRELEEERIRELEAYLKVTGLSDATLTKADQDALDKMNMGGVKWKKFKLGDILDFISIRQAKSQSAIPTDDNKSTRVPYIVQSTKNNMFRRNVNKQYLIDHDEPVIKGNCVVLGVTLPAVSYQPDEFGGSQLIVARSKWLNNKTGLFLATAIKKQMYQFSYSHKPGMRIYKALDIELPVTPAGDIDFDFMENYITAIEKQSIRGVIEYKDKVIQTTKDVVNAN